MKVSSSNQAYVFLAMVLCGALCTVIFDVFRALRRLRKSPSGIIALQDIVFWIIELTIVYIVAFKLNYAKVRAYEIIALVMGSVIYFVTLSEYVIRILYKIMVFGVKVIQKLILPFAKLAKFAAGPVIRLKVFVGLKMRKLKKSFALKIRGVGNKIAAALKRVFSVKKSGEEENINCDDATA